VGFDERNCMGYVFDYCCGDRSVMRAFWPVFKVCFLVYVLLIGIWTLAYVSGALVMGIISVIARAI
jgi:hypothetical protein